MNVSITLKWIIGQISVPVKMIKHTHFSGNRKIIKRIPKVLYVFEMTAPHYILLNSLWKLSGIMQREIKKKINITWIKMIRTSRMESI